MDIYTELFRDKEFIYVQILNYPESINKKIHFKEFDLWKKDKIER